MRSNLHAAAIREIEAALTGIAESISASSAAKPPPDLLLTPLSRVGDALRLGIEMPSPIRRWLESLSEADVKAALSSLIEETATWSLPPGRSAAIQSDPSVAFVLRRRDEAESVRIAVQRILLPRGRNPYELAEFAALETALDGRDKAIDALVSRDDVVRLLGTRSAMGPTWANVFHADSGSADAVPIDGRWPDSLSQSPPSDEIVTRYATRGAMSRYVEGVAAANEEFAAELAACIDALLEAREDVGLVARRWRKRARIASPSDPLRFAVVPAARLAAASTAAAVTAKTVISLGVLSPLDAEGRLEISAHDVTLIVFEGQKAIERVELGSKVVAAPVAPSKWEIAVALPSDAIRVRVVAKDGNECSEELRFDPLDSSHEQR